jgi:hypothetical protein
MLSTCHHAENMPWMKEVKPTEMKEPAKKGSCGLVAGYAVHRTQLPPSCREISANEAITQN